MKITSPAFENGAPIPAIYTCDGENANPSLQFINVPAGTRTLALTMEDPDVPRALKADGLFDHWILFNMPPGTMEIPQDLDTVDCTGIHGANGAGQPKYMGPCPPLQYEPSEHRYIFKLYALDTELPLAEGATKQEVMAAIQGHSIETAQLIGRYRRADDNVYP